MSYTSTIVGLGGTLNERSTSLFALTTALNAATRTGARTELLDLRNLELPMYVPGKLLEAYGENVGKLVATLEGADGLLISTAAYQGTLAGVTKNALDFLIRRDEDVSRAIGLFTRSYELALEQKARREARHPSKPESQEVKQPPSKER